MIRFLLTVPLILAAACATKAPGPAADAPVRRHISATVVQEPPPASRVLPFNGRIAQVNDKLRFVIVDFTNSSRPELDQRLGVYRVGQKVAEIKISGPFRNTTVAADITAGEARYGDEVRTE